MDFSDRSVRVGGLWVSAVVLCVASASAMAASSPEWIKQTRVTGQVRQYDFYRTFDRLVDTQHGVSFGGWLQAETGSIEGFNLVAGFYTAQSFGLNPSDTKNLYPTLPSDNVTALGQAYIQYRGYGLQARAGNQMLDTPWTNAIDLRMIPPIYQGVSIRYDTPVNGLSFEADRMFQYKPWEADHYGHGDSGYSFIGDTSYKYNAAAPLPSVQTTGLVALGSRYDVNGFEGNLWYYDFHEREQMAYGDISAALPVQAFGLDYRLAAQYGRLWDTSNQTAPYQNVDSELYGAQLSIASPHDTLKLAYNYVPVKDDRFRGGGFVTPYQDGLYAGADYTATLLQVIASNGLPGQAYSIKNVTKFGPWKLLLAFGQYFYKDARGVHQDFHAFQANSYWATLGYDFTKNFGVTNAFGRVSEGGAALGGVTVDYLRFKYSFAFGGASQSEPRSAPIVHPH